MCHNRYVSSSNHQKILIIDSRGTLAQYFITLNVLRKTWKSQKLIQANFTKKPHTTKYCESRDFEEMQLGLLSEMSCLSFSVSFQIVFKVRRWIIHSICITWWWVQSTLHSYEYLMVSHEKTQNYFKDKMLSTCYVERSQVDAYQNTWTY